MTLFQEVDDLVEDWTPEPLVAPLTPFEETENEKRPVIIGYIVFRPRPTDADNLQPIGTQIQTRKRPHRHKPRLLQLLQLPRE